MLAVVTGGAGFIGSHLCERLRRDGVRVLCVDDLSTGSRENLASLTGDDEFDFLQRDVREPLDDLPKVDLVYHLACPAAVATWDADPIGTAKTSFLGTLHALELARRSGARLLFTSTAEVYGDPDVHPQPEHYRGAVDPMASRSCYDEGKRIAETLCADFARVHGVDTRVARVFNTYGPRMPKQGVIHVFMRRCQRGKPLTIFGRGEQTRTFCYVDDLVDGLVRLMNHPEAPKPVNLGHAEEVTIFELAEAMKAATSSTSELVYEPPRLDDPAKRCPDTSRARGLLSWVPQVGLQDGLRRTVPTG